MYEAFLRARRHTAVVGPKQEQDAPLTIPQLNRLHESIVRGEDASNVDVTSIPSQNRVTLQILRLWQTFKDLNQTCVVSNRAEQFRFRTQQRVVVTVEDSVLRTEMTSLRVSRGGCPQTYPLV